MSHAAILLRWRVLAAPSVPPPRIHSGNIFRLSAACYTALVITRQNGTKKHVGLCVIACPFCDNAELTGLQELVGEPTDADWRALLSRAQQVKQIAVFRSEDDSLIPLLAAKLREVPLFPGLRGATMVDLTPAAAVVLLRLLLPRSSKIRLSLHDHFALISIPNMVSSCSPFREVRIYTPSLAQEADAWATACSGVTALQEVRVNITLKAATKDCLERLSQISGLRRLSLYCKSFAVADQVAQAFTKPSSPQSDIFHSLKALDLHIPSLIQVTEFAGVLQDLSDSPLRKVSLSFEWSRDQDPWRHREQCDLARSSLEQLIASVGRLKLLKVLVLLDFRDDHLKVRSRLPIHYLRPLFGCKALQTLSAPTVLFDDLQATRFEEMIGAWTKLTSLNLLQALHGPKHGVVSLAEVDLFTRFAKSVVR